MVKEYIIVGDTDKYEGCLVKLAGYDFEKAKALLNKMLTNPDDNDKYLMKGQTNFRIEEVNSNECWWNDPFLSN